jgi:hypothetical protein
MLTKCLPLRHPLPPMRGSSVSPDLALLLYELVDTHLPSLVVELGAGVSTLVLGYALERVGRGRLIAFEHDAAQAQHAASLVRRHRLERQVQVVHAGLQETRLAGEAWQWYGPRDRGDAGRPARAAGLRRRPAGIAAAARALSGATPARAVPGRRRDRRPRRRRPPRRVGDRRALAARRPRLTLQRIAHEKGTAILTRSR